MLWSVLSGTAGQGRAQGFKRGKVQKARGQAMGGGGVRNQVLCEG